MGKASRIKAKHRLEKALAERERSLNDASHSQKLRWADEQTDALDESIQGWLHAGGYTLIDKPDPETRHHILYAQIKDLPSNTWALMVGDAAHSLRCSLDHMIFAALEKHLGSVNSDALETAEFTIMGMRNRRGGLRTAPDNDFESTVVRNFGSDLPDGFIEALRDLQPYKRGAQFETDELWLVHDLDRVDKHRHIHVVTATTQLRNLSFGGTGVLPYFWFGGGVTEDGDKVCEWADPQGPAPHLNASIARQVVLGKPEAGAGRELVPLLRALHVYIETVVLPALDTFL